MPDLSYTVFHANGSEIASGLDAVEAMHEILVNDRGSYEVRVDAADGQSYAPDGQSYFRVWHSERGGDMESTVAAVWAKSETEALPLLAAKVIAFSGESRGMAYAFDDCPAE